MTTDAENQDRGFVQIPSSHSVAATIERLESRLEEHGITIFARLDFAADASRAGLDMRPERMLVFGNPKAGTPLMQAVPASGLDLPLKVLVWADEGGTKVSYTAPQALAARYDLPPDLAGNLAGIDALTDALVAE